MKSAFFIMKLWQTGNIGSRNIAKADGQLKDGYPTYDIARNAIVNLHNEGKSDFISGLYMFTVNELFWF